MPWYCRNLWCLSDHVDGCRMSPRRQVGEGCYPRMTDTGLSESEPPAAEHANYRLHVRYLILV